jgi:hypothetical protein
VTIAFPTTSLNTQFNMHLSFLFTAAFASIAIAQYTSTTATTPESSRGTNTVTPYSAHSPGYTPSWVDTSTMPAFSGAPSNTSSWSSAKYHNSTYALTATTSSSSQYSTASLTSGGSATVASTSTGPVIPISTTNAGTVKRVAGTSLALLAAGSWFSLLL